jgi:hypothetical protein
MRWPTLATAALAVAAAFSTVARAEDNPWCAYFSGGPTERGFATLGVRLRRVTLRRYALPKRYPAIAIAKSPSYGGSWAASLSRRGSRIRTPPR